MTTKNQIRQWLQDYPRLVCVGGYWGDEGKGKLIDGCGGNYDIYVRYSGGNNAGHTVVVGDVTFTFHLLPSGFATGKTCVLSPGVLFNLDAAIAEIEENTPKLSGAASLVLVDRRCPLWTPYHALLEEYIEHQRGDDKIGTTRKAQGPLRALNVLREGAIVSYLDQPERLLNALTQVHDLFEQNFAQMSTHIILQPQAVHKQLIASYGAAKRLMRFGDTRAYLRDAITADKRILFEGSQATGLSVDAGTWPFVTSSSVTSGGVSSGTLLPPGVVSGTLVTFKLFPTRVGSGPMPSELSTRDDIQAFADTHPVLFKDRRNAFDPDRCSQFLSERLARYNAGDLSPAEVGEYLLVKQQELGATTGRARSPGRPDLAWARYAIEVNDPIACVLNRLDAGSGMEQIEVVTGYRYRGALLRPGDVFAPQLDEVEPHIEVWRGWKEDISGMTEFSQLPTAAQQFVSRFEQDLKCPIAFIGTGPGRDDFIFRSVPKRYTLSH